MTLKWKAQNFFWISYFALVVTLCADGDNGRMIYASIFLMFFFSIAMNLKISKVKLYQKTNVWYFFFCVFAALSLIWSISRADSYGMIKLLFRQLMAIVALGISLNSIKDIYKALKIYLIACAIMMIKISFYILHGYSGAKMWDAICGNYFNTVAQILALSIIVAFYFLLTENGKTKRLLYLIYIAFAAYHIVITGSRKGLIMPFVGLAIYLIIKSGINLKKILETVGVFLIVGSLLIYILSQNEELISRLSMLVELVLSGNAVDESSVFRKAFIVLANKMFISSPVLGCGINSFASQCLSMYGRFYYSHNNFYEILSGVGVIGFILYYWIYAYSIYKFFVLRKSNNLYILGLSVWLTLIIFEYGIVTYSVLLYPILLTILAVTYRTDIVLEGE